MDASLMEVSLVIAAILCVLLLLGAFYRWCMLFRRARRMQERITPQQPSIAIIASTTAPRRSMDSHFSEEVGPEILYESTCPPYSSRPPDYQPPPVFPDEPPPSYASIAREDRRQQRRMRMVNTRSETRLPNT